MTLRQKKYKKYLFSDTDYRKPERYRMEGHLRPLDGKLEGRTETEDKVKEKSRRKDKKGPGKGED